MDLFSFFIAKIYELKKKMKSNEINIESPIGTVLFEVKNEFKSNIRNSFTIGDVAGENDDSFNSW